MSPGTAAVPVLDLDEARSAGTANVTDAIAEVIRTAVAAGVREAMQVHDPTNRRLLTVEQTAEYLALSKRVIWEMLAAHELPVVARGRRKMVDIRDLDAWIETNKR
jgi:excisionase family DNA binding protein